MISKRNIFIINPDYQYKFCLIICSLVFLGSLIYPFTIFDLFEKFISLNPEATVKYEGHRMSLLILLAITQIAFLGIVFVCSIFISHKTAGPLYKLTMYLQGLRNGDERKELKFRKGDHFQDIADEVNQTLSYLENKKLKQAQLLDEVSQYIENISGVVPEDKRPVISEILEKIKNIQKDS